MKTRAFHGLGPGGTAGALAASPTTPHGFAGAIAGGDVLPPQSTRFPPKAVSGLVWAAHADPVT